MASCGSVLPAFVSACIVAVRCYFNAMVALIGLSRSSMLLSLPGAKLNTIEPSNVEQFCRFSCIFGILFYFLL